MTTKTKAVGKLVRVPSGAPGTRRTLQLMRRMILAGVVNPSIRVLALKLTRHLPERDTFGEINACFRYVRDTIRYVRDIYNVETLQTPEKTEELGQGDCDDKVILLASLLGTIGIPSRLVAVGFNHQLYSHVYLEARIAPGHWIGLESIMKWEPGRTAPGVTSRMAEDIWPQAA